MNKIIFSILIIIVSLITFSSIGTVTYATTTIQTEIPNPTIVSESFNKAIVDIIGEKKAKGATATLIMNGEVVMKKGYGFANENLGLVANGDSIGFRIGSISKTFVAVAALIAMEDGKIDMNTDISKYLDSDFPKLKYPVTMQNLLTHTAGFEEQITGMAVKNYSDTEPLYVSIRKYMPEQISKPGEVSSYSNYGIGLAAYVIESVTGEDFADYCMNKIFKPLEMNKTTFAHMQDTVYLSHAYLPNGKETVDYYMNIYPEGSAVSTAADMGKYIQWLLNKDENILSIQNKQKLFERQYSMGDELNGIGYIWNRKAINDSIYYEKKGETLCFFSKIALFPENKAGLFLSFNTHVSEQDINKITKTVTGMLLGENEKSVSKPGATLNINGCYVNSWSSFKTAEKLLRFIIPSKMIDISGSLSKGYKFNDESITHMGNNTYDTPIGIVKFLQKDGKTLMATDFSQTYIRINGLENKGTTLIISILFIISTLIYIIMTFTSYLKKNTLSILPTIISIIQIIAVFVQIIIIYNGIIGHSLLNYVFYINIINWIIVLMTIINITYNLTNSSKSDKTVLKYSYFHSIISIVFCLVMINLNLLL